VTRVKDGCKTTTWWQGFNQNVVNVIVYNMTGGLEVYGIDDLVVTVIFVTIEILGLTAMSGIMEATNKSLISAIFRLNANLFHPQ